MLKFVFPLCYKYSIKYHVIASLMAPPSFVLYVYTISFVGTFARSIMITLSISARIGSMFRYSQKLWRTKHAKTISGISLSFRSIGLSKILHYALRCLNVHSIWFLTNLNLVLNITSLLTWHTVYSFIM